MAQLPNNQNGHACPHWSLQSRSCRASHGGLYLPVLEHVEIYCEGGNFGSCYQYMEETLRADFAAAEEVKRNRRRHRRVPCRYSFRLAERKDNAGLDRLFDDVATTVDLSSGGIRFESYRALPQGVEVSFSLNGEFSSVPLKGTGQVKWCRSLEDAPLYHAGIAFSDKAVGAAVRERLSAAIS